MINLSLARTSGNFRCRVLFILIFFLQFFLFSTTKVYSAYSTKPIINTQTKISPHDPRSGSSISNSIKTISSSIKSAQYIAPITVPESSSAPVTPAAAGCGTYRDLGYQMALQRNWGPYWSQLDTLISRESGWRNCAQNPYSAACGIGQNINGCTVGYDPTAQINWTFNYIYSRYSNPANAEMHEVNFGWY